MASNAGPGAAGATSRWQLLHPHPLRKWYVAVLVAWMALSVVLWGRLAQDAVPYQVAGQLVRDHPHEVYASRSGDLFDLERPFYLKWCQDAPAGTHCDRVAVAFVSMPASLPLAALWAAPGPEAGVALARLLASGSLAVGMLVLWNRLAGRSRDAPRHLLLTVVLLSPMAAVPIVLGQTSPYLFLLACLGVQRTDHPGRRWFVAATWALTIALKLFPAALGLVVLWQRRFRLLWATAAAGLALCLLTLALAPVSIWSDFVRMSAKVTTHSVGNPYSGSLDNVAHQLWAPLSTNHVASDLLLALRAVLAIGLWWWGVRDADDDTQWAYGWLALMLVVPLVWWHYLWVAVAALGIALASRRVDARWLWTLPVLAALTVPASVINNLGHSTAIGQGVFLVAAAVAVPLVVRTGRGQPEGRTRSGPAPQAERS